MTKKKKESLEELKEILGERAILFMEAQSNVYGGALSVDNMWCSPEPEIDINCLDLSGVCPPPIVEVTDECTCPLPESVRMFSFPRLESVGITTHQGSASMFI